MADEPSNAELGRRLDRIDLRIESGMQSLVSRAEFAVAFSHVEQRLAALAEERRELLAALAEERRARQEADDVIKKQIAEADKGSGVNLRQLIYSGLIPGILLLITFLVQFSQAKGGK